jgi:hypothetical protein
VPDLGGTSDRSSGALSGSGPDTRACGFFAAFCFDFALSFNGTISYAGAPSRTRHRPTLQLVRSQT